MGFYRNNEGQTTTEYILLLAVVVLMGISIGRRIKEYMVGNSDCPNDSLICQIEAGLGGDGYFTGSYRYFKMRK